MTANVSIRRVPEAEYSDPVNARTVLYRAVRDAIDDVTPFARYVGPGARVFVLCNFVSNHRPGETARRFAAKCTQAAVVRPVVDALLEVVGPRGRVDVGNAPIQGADWERMLRETRLAELLAHHERCGAPVHATDLRKHVLVDRVRGEVRVTDVDGVPIDLGVSSLLESSAGNRNYRVLQYDPARTAACHGPAHHLYKVAARVLDADLIVSIPKLKTHMKVGVTCGLKGCVGAITEKQCLAHHRKGSPRQGGDEYPDGQLLGRLLSRLGDRAWGGRPGAGARMARRLERVGLAASRHLRVPVGGSWLGNDTAWRMALDVVRCLRFADREGCLQQAEQRRHLVIADGVIGGAGEGPLVPDPVDSRCVVAATDPYAADLVAAHIMGLDLSLLPIVTRAPGPGPWPVTDLAPADVAPLLDGRPASLASLAGQFPTFPLPHAWRQRK